MLGLPRIKILKVLGQRLVVKFNVEPGKLAIPSTAKTKTKLNKTMEAQDHESVTPCYFQGGLCVGPANEYRLTPCLSKAT